MNSLRSAFHRPTSPSYRVVAAVVWALILVSVMVLIAEALIPDGHSIHRALRAFDRLLLAVFAVELALRVLSHRPPDLDVFRRPALSRLRIHVTGRVRYLLKPLLLIDLITVAALVPALRGLRVLRLLRLLRTERVFRYGNPFAGTFHALERDRLLFTLAFGFLFCQVVLGGMSLYLIERDSNQEIGSPADAFWWALVTITTVGFGDIIPVTQLGRAVAGVLMIGGMFTLATFAGIVGHSLLNAVLSIREDQFRMGNYVNHLVVCGYEPGMNLLHSALLEEHDTERTDIVIFTDQERPVEIPPALHWVRGDPTKESELDKARLAHAAAVVIAGARSIAPQQADAHTILTLFTIRSFLNRQRMAQKRQRPLYLVAEILDSENVDHARTAGADEVIETRRLGFSLLAHAVSHPGTADTLSRVVLHGSNNLYVGRQPGDLGASTYGELASMLELRQRGGLVIGVVQGDGEEQINPSDDLPVDQETSVLYLAEERLLETK